MVLYGVGLGDLTLAGLASTGGGNVGFGQGHLDLLAAATAIAIILPLPGLVTISDRLAYIATLSAEQCSVLGVADAFAYLTEVQSRLAFEASIEDTIALIQIQQTADSMVHATDSITPNTIVHGLAYKATVSDQLATSPTTSAALASSGIIVDEDWTSTSAVTVP